MNRADVLIIGGGLAGLSCALKLQQSGIQSRVLEASDGVGGRARTDLVDGFKLDRGFQVLLTAYPAAQAILDLDDLNLRPFEPGALIRRGGKFHRFVDPWRRPRHAISAAFAPVASFSDKLKVASLRKRVCRGSLDDLYALPETTTLEALRSQGFSDRIIESFFRPFMGGVFLESELHTSSRKFDFVFRMFAQGDAAIPANGMGAMAEQLAGKLADGSVQTDAAVREIKDHRVVLADGQEWEANQIVLACDLSAADKLTGHQEEHDWNSVSCLYFAADQAPIEDPILVLNGDGDGPINNLCVPTQVAPSYGPAGQSLISVSVIGVSDDENVLKTDVQSQLVDWFGSAARRWRHLRTYVIQKALPAQAPPALSPVKKPARDDHGVLRCGDYLDTASIQGALSSGQRAADAILELAPAG